MRYNRMKNNVAACVMAAGLLAAAKATADQPATAGNPCKTSCNEQSYTGIVKSVDPQARQLQVKESWYTPEKRFDLSAKCAFALEVKSPGSINDLRPGEKVTVNYQTANGVLIADRVTEQPMRYTGTVKSIDPNTHMLTLEGKEFRLPDNCTVALRGNQSGTLASIQPGNYVTVTYDTPNDTATAREIRMTSELFTGDVTSIDLDSRTIAAKSGFEQKQFQLGHNCAIVLHGQIGGKLADLRPEERLQFSYNDINGVNIVNRIALAQAKTSSSAYLSQPRVGFGY